MRLKRQRPGPHGRIAGLVPSLPFSFVRPGIRLTVRVLANLDPAGHEVDKR